MLCIAAAGLVTGLAVSEFTLSWTHSVEHTRWEEHWVVEDDALRVVSGTVQGSGAGIALPPDAVRSAGGWTYSPSLPPQKSVSLAASGATGGGWTLCTEHRCIELGRDPGDTIVLSAGAQCP